MQSNNPCFVPDTYLVLNKPGRAAIKVKGSRFLAEALSVSSPEEAAACLAQIKKRDYDATHHCFAYRLGKNGFQFRYSDDGEPSSSAGLPIMRQIEGRNITDVLVVVVRYYGGTKLGTGGLVRAYSEAAGLALENASIKEIIPRTAITAVFEYPDTSPAMHIIGKYDIVIASTDYGNQTKLNLEVRSSQLSDFENSFREALAGRGALLP